LLELLRFNLLAAYVVAHFGCKDHQFTALLPAINSFASDIRQAGGKGFSPPAESPAYSADTLSPAATAQVAA
jgi:hypothetical protein